MGHMDELHKISELLIERETIDKDQFERLLAGEAVESVFPEPEPEPEREPERKPRIEPQPRPSRFRGRSRSGKRPDIFARRVDLDGLVNLSHALYLRGWDRRRHAYWI